MPPAIWAAETVPLTLLAVPAKIAYGVGMRACNGFSAAKVLAPLVRTLIASHVELPVKTLPKSRVVAKSPLVTPTARLVTVTPTWLPPLAALASAN